MWRSAALLLSLLALPALAEPIEVRSQKIPLTQGVQDAPRLDALAYRGGLELTSPDRRFGGLSGLVVSADGARLLAISDTGLWLEATLTYDDDGNLSGLSGAEITPLRADSGAVLSGKRDADAEGLVALSDGGYLVSFERRHRVLHYGAPGANGAPVWMPDALASVDGNGGLEALAMLGDGHLLALCEDEFVSDGRLGGWLVDGETAEAVTWPGDGYFKPTAASVLPDGRVLVLERGYTAIAGPKGRLMLIDDVDDSALSGREIARFQPPIQVDNYEGLASLEMAGETRLFIVSDDNFNPLQRTLLLSFALTDQLPPCDCDRRRGGAR
ncbi:MAG: esterase-like activity of phytase family protein [Alphaproteobacteria bacterium]|nr:esterase-like activity of phytase family protein [Alphaproteobacteria bacterium]